MAGILYLVATPIGNFDDITQRALNVLRSVDLVVYEERREGERLLRHYAVQKPVESLNEHNEAAAAAVVIRHLQEGRSVALVSDCGTPVFSDPGRILVRKAIDQRIRIVPVPGASSLLPALTVSGFQADQFLFYGWLSQKKDRRRAELRSLQQERKTIVLMETPYRLLPLLRDIAEVMGDSRNMCLALDVTMPTEQFLYGTAKELHRRCTEDDIRGEFVLVIEGIGRNQKG